MTRLLLLFLSLWLLGSCAWGESRGSPNQKAIIGGYQVIRCHFDEKRIVVKKHGKILVLSENEQLPETGIRVVRIQKKQAILEKRDETKKKEYFLLEEKNGVPVLRILKNRLDTQPALPASSQELILVPQTAETEKKN